MTLPTLTPCPKLDCRAPIAHWHGGDSGNLYACSPALNGKPCPHGGGQGYPCYAPRVTSPLHLPDVDAVARVVREACETWEKAEVVGLNDAPLPETIAQAVLDLIAAHQPVWVEVPKGTLIIEGTRYRLVCADGSSYERIAGCDFRSGDGSISIDPRTIPAPTLTERIRAACNDSPESRITLDVADVEALLDMVGGEDK